MELLYATGNPAKLESMRGFLSGLPLRVLGLRDVGAPDIEVLEDGDTPLENARKKALAYHAHLKRPLFSCDSGLWLEGFPPELQPGAHVRTHGGPYMDDEAMISHYGGLARERGGRILARYMNAICLIDGEGRVHESDRAELAWPAFYLCAIPHPGRRKGFPLDSLSVHIKTMKYYEDIPPEERDEEEDLSGAFCGFFREALGV